MTVRQRDLRGKRKQPVPFALKLQPFLGSQGRCLKHFRVPGKKFWKVPGGGGVEGRNILHKGWVVRSRHRNSWLRKEKWSQDRGGFKNPDYDLYLLSCLACLYFLGFSPTCTVGYKAQIKVSSPLLQADLFPRLMPFFQGPYSGTVMFQAFQFHPVSSGT